MERAEAPATVAGVTRGRLLRAGAAAAAGGAFIGSRRGGASTAAPSRAMDEKILNLFLTLEYVQESFYRQAAESGGLEGELLQLASTVGEQESEHVNALTDQLASAAKPRPRSDFGDAFQSPQRFREAAIALEEAAIAAYVGQTGHLGRRAMRAVVTLVSVEARQVAWLRDLAGVNPAPRAADPARGANDVLGELRKKGFLS